MFDTIASDPCWLMAAGNELQLVVYRSVELRDTDPELYPVAEHIEQHRMVLADQVTVDHSGFMFGRVQISWWLSPVARRDGMALQDFQGLLK